MRAVTCNFYPDYECEVLSKSARCASQASVEAMTEISHTELSGMPKFHPSPYCKAITCHMRGEKQYSLENAFSKNVATLCGCADTPQVNFLFSTCRTVDKINLTCRWAYSLRCPISFAGVFLVRIRHSSSSAASLTDAKLTAKLTEPSCQQS